MKENTRKITIRCTDDVYDLFTTKAFFGKKRYGDFLEKLLEVYIEKEMETEKDNDS